MNFPSIDYFFNLDGFEHKEIFIGVKYPWEALQKLNGYSKNYLRERKKRDFYAGKGAVIDKTAKLEGPIVIGKNCRIGYQAYLRGPVIIGNGCFIGRTEIKNSIIFSDVRATHFNYLGDSVIGNRVNFGAGSKIANLRFDRKKIEIRYKRKKLFTSLEKFGAIIGDNSQLGCNSVLNPGVILGRNCLVYPLANIKSNFYSSESIIKR